MSSKRENALSLIRAEVAQFGRITSRALLLYSENRISWGKFQEAVKSGIALRESTDERLGCYMFTHNICECPYDKCYSSHVAE